MKTSLLLALLLSARASADFSGIWLGQGQSRWYEEEFRVCEARFDISQSTSALTFYRSQINCGKGLGETWNGTFSVKGNRLSYLDLEGTIDERSIHIQNSSGNLLSTWDYQLDGNSLTMQERQLNLQTGKTILAVDLAFERQ